MTPVTAGVRVPCSTSNLGSGFDTLGLALDRHLEARFTPAPREGLVLERRGTLSVLELPMEEDLAVQAFRHVAADEGWTPAGTLTLHSEIPLARGLGSSAAALVAGHAVARAALGLPEDRRAAFELAASVEGHGDNAAPCAFGGLHGVAHTGDRIRAVPLELSSEVGFAYAAPAAGISTRAAREALPATVEHATAVRELGRLTALLRGLATADPELVRIGIQDELHVPHRLPLIPGAVNAISAGYDAGAWAVTISGAGSGLIALCARSDAEGVARAMHRILAPDDAADAVGLVLTPDLNGMRVLTP